MKKRKSQNGHFKVTWKSTLELHLNIFYLLCDTGSAKASAVEWL